MPSSGDERRDRGRGRTCASVSSGGWTGVGDVPAQPPSLHGGELNRGMVPRPLAPSGPAPGGDAGRTGGLRVGRRFSRAGAPRARRASGFERSRSDRIGRPSGVASRTGQGTRDGRVVPGEAELVGAVVLVRHEVESSSGSSARKPWATPVGITTQSSAPSSRVSTTGADRPPSSSGRTSTSATNARPLGDDPVGRAGAGGGGGRGGRRPPRSRGWPGRSGSACGAPVSRRQRRNADARQSSRNEPRCRRAGRSRRSGRRAAPTADRVGRSSRRPARARRSAARSRPSRPATAGAARRRRQRRRREDAPARRRRRALPGRRRDVLRPRRRRRPGRTT